MNNSTSSNINAILDLSIQKSEVDTRHPFMKIFLEVIPPEYFFHYVPLKDILSLRPVCRDLVAPCNQILFPSLGDSINPLVDHLYQKLIGNAMALGKEIYWASGSIDPLRRQRSQPVELCLFKLTQGPKVCRNSIFAICVQSGSINMDSMTDQLESTKPKPPHCDLDPILVNYFFKNFNHLTILMLKTIKLGDDACSQLEKMKLSLSLLSIHNCSWEADGPNLDLRLSSIERLHLSFTSPIGQFFLPIDLKELIADFPSSPMLHMFNTGAPEVVIDGADCTKLQWA